MKSRIFYSFAILVLAVSGLFLGGKPLTVQAAPSPAAPGISVSPSSGNAGTAVTISGSGFEPGGYDGTIQWDGASQSTFAIPSGGVFSVGFTIPSGASVGSHTISVCAACGDGDVEQRASTGFSVTSPLEPVVPPVPVTVVPAIPGVCTTFNLGPDAQVLNFDSLLPGARLASVAVGGTNVNFTPGTAYVNTPPIAAHSGSQAIRSAYDDFGSAGHPIVFSFSTGQSAVGLYVGREPLGAYDHDTLFAVLTAYGYDAGLNLVEIASDQVPLPAEPTPIQRCVVVRAPAGQGIRSLTLDYVTADGASAYDHRWVDDLTFAGAASLPDAPPTVQIMYPTNGSTITTNDVSVLARVHEDVGLASVTYSLNGAAPATMTFAPVGGSDPTLFEARATIPAADVRLATPYQIVITATDSASQTGQATATFTHNPSAVGDIWITGIEVTQAIQTLDNRIPLIGGKSTAVRVYVQSIEDARGPWTGVMATLTVGGHTYQPALIDPRIGLTVAPGGSNRETTNDSFVFLLNAADTATGTRSLQVSLVPPAGRTESNTANDTASQDMLFYPPLSVSIYGLAYQNINPTLGPASWSDFDAHRLYTQAVFPVTGFSILHLPGDLALSFDNTTGEAYIRAREWAGRWLASMPAGTRIYLLQPEDTCECGYSSGDGWMNGQNNHGISTGTVMAQEVAHNLGLWWHAAGTHPADMANTAFPYFHDSTGPQVGFDTRSLQPVTNPGGHVHDIMSYGGPPAWISPYTYCALLGVLSSETACPTGANRASVPGSGPQAAARNPAPLFTAGLNEFGFSFAPARQAAEGQFLYVAGQLNPDGTAAFAPFELISSTGDITQIPDGAAYRLTLRDGSNRILTNYDFEPLVTHENPDEPLLFNLVIPFDPAARRISLYQGGALLAERTASANAPQVTLLSPANGENWSGLQTISWQASDADNDPLTYTLEYSADGGATWTALNTGLVATTLEVNFDSMPGSANALVRVSATDGFNTTSAVSGAFSVPAKGPQVTIEAPADGTTALQSVPFIVSASAFDWEDGPIVNPEAFVWSSDKDGQLGTGSWIVLSSLSPGEHTLTVTVSDSQNNQASASLHVTIEALQAAAQAQAGLPAWIWIAAGLLLVLVLGGAGVFLVRARKK